MKRHERAAIFHGAFSCIAHTQVFLREVCVISTWGCIPCSCHRSHILYGHKPTRIARFDILAGQWFVFQHPLAGVEYWSITSASPCGSAWHRVHFHQLFE